MRSLGDGTDQMVLRGAAACGACSAAGDCRVLHQMHRECCLTRQS
jgi:hypothetical protein